MGRVLLVVAGCFLFLFVLVVRTVGDGISAGVVERSGVILYRDHIK